MFCHWAYSMKPSRELSSQSSKNHSGSSQRGFPVYAISVIRRIFSFWTNLIFSDFELTSLGTLHRRMLQGLCRFTSRNTDYSVQVSAFCFYYCCSVRLCERVSRSHAHKSAIFPDFEVVIQEVLRNIYQF
jgi:hypothetical protein